MLRRREPPPPLPLWKRDALHLIVGTTSGVLITFIFLRIFPQVDEPDVARYRAVRDFVLTSYVREVGSEDLADRALRGMVESLDPYSRYYDRTQIAELDRSTSGHFQGIGVVFAPLQPPGQVLFAMPGTPAAEAGLTVGDRIAEAGGRDVAALTVDELRRTISDAAGGELELRVVARGGAERTVRVTPRELVDPTLRHVRMLDEDRRIGYLAVSSFTRQTGDEFDGAIEALCGSEGLEGLEGLVVDVRGNLGGVLDAAVAIARRFVAEGLLVTHQSRGEKVVYEADPDEARHLGLPLVVLVDEASASASEVFAAALQEHRAAAVVGSPTYGKGMVQQVRGFGDAAVVKLTTSYYYTPSHRNIERTVDDAWESGLVPDLAVELTPEETAAVHRHLASYGVPDEALDAVRAWEAEVGASLVPTHPPDAQLEAALGLFLGERPGAWNAAEATAP